MKIRVVVLVVLVAMFGAACSASVETDSSSSRVDTEDPGPVATVETGSAAAPDEDAEPVATVETSSAAAPDEDPEPVATVETSSAAALLGSDDWCVAAAQIENILEPEILGDPVELEKSYGEAVALIGEAARIAPPAIAADVAMMAEAVVAFSALLDEAEWDFLDVDLAAMEEVAIGMDVPGYNIEKYNFDVCGIGEDPGEFEALDFDTDDFDEPLPQGSARDLMVDSFLSSGFSEAEADCLANGIDFSDPDALADPSVMLDVFADCGISIDRLSQLGG